MRLLFIAIADSTVGYGHLNRCLSLAVYADKQGILVTFLLFGDNNAGLQLVRSGFRCLQRHISELRSQSISSILKELEIDSVVTDFSLPKVFGSVAESREILERIRSNAEIVVVIDGMGEQALATTIRNMPVDILVVPYVGAIAPCEFEGIALVGAAYAVLAQPYQQLAERRVLENANRILVSCGGADSARLTPVVLEGLQAVSRDLEVRVIVGPLFDDELKAAILRFSSYSKHVVQLVDSPENLAIHMRWCDLAITTSGLIKYELAATSTPGLLMSIDDEHDRINRPFAKSGAVVDLGREITASIIEDQVRKLLDDFEARVAMAQAGRKLVDGRGAERVINEIIGMYSIHAKKEKPKTTI